MGILKVGILSTPCVLPILNHDAKGVVWDEIKGCESLIFVKEPSFDVLTIVGDSCG